MSHLHRAVDQGRDLGIDGVECRHLEQRRLADPTAEMLQAVALLAQSPDFVLAAIELRVARMVAVKAAGIDLDRAGSAAGTGALDRLTRGFVHRKEIVATDLDSRQAEPGRTSGDVTAADGIAYSGAFAVLVVLEHKDRRQLQHHRHVHRLEGGALVRAAVAGERDRDGAASQGLGGQCGADHERRPATDDAVGAEHAAVEIGDVHRSTLAAAQPALFGEQLLHHQNRVAALGDAVAMAAMGARDVVPWPEMRADADGCGFLPSIEVDKSGNAALRELFLHALLEAADRDHVAIGLQQFFAAQLHGTLPTISRPIRRFCTLGDGLTMCRLQRRLCRISLRLTGRNSQTSTPTSNCRGSGFSLPWEWPCRLTQPLPMPRQLRNG